MNPLQELIFLYRFCRNKLGLSRLRSMTASLRGDLTIMRIGAAGSSQGTTPIACGGTSVYYSYHQDAKYLNAMGIWLLANSPGALGNPNLKIQMEQSYIAPTTEGIADNNWVIGDGVPDIYTNLNDGATQIAHIKTLALVPMRKYRLKITGLGSNPSDTTLLAIIFQQEMII